MSLDVLPPEILERIVLSPVLSARDVLNVSQTCQRIRSTCANSEIWRELFRRKYEHIYQNIPHHSAREIDWKQEYENLVQTCNDARKKILSLSSRFYQRNELSSTDFHEFDDCLLKTNPGKDFAHLYLLHYLRNVLAESHQHTDLTLKYYGMKVVSHVQHRLLLPQVDHFVQTYKNTRSHHVFEEVLVLIAAWCQPEKHITQDTVKTSLDDLAHNIFIRLKQKGVVDESAEMESLSQQTKSPELEAAILDCTNQFLEDEGFNGNSGDYYNADNSYINRILETKLGIPISLSLLYLCVVGRLGVLVEPVNFPRHFLLRWNQHPASAKNKYTYIDVFRKGKRMTEAETSEILPPVGIPMTQEYYQTASALHSAQRMLRNLIAIGSSSSNTMRDSNYSLLRSALELMLKMSAESDNLEDFAFMLIRVYLQLNINHEDVERMCENCRNVPAISAQVDSLLAHCREQKEALRHEGNQIIPKRRENEEFPYGEIRFRVGQVARHRRYHYDCVVYGWDSRCTASSSWIRQMRVDQLPKQDKQPFFNVLVTDGSNRYAADENLELCSRPVTISHREIGKYFKEFDPEKGYIPNDELKAEYPDDV